MSTAPASLRYQIHALHGGRDLKHFIRVPWHVFADDPYWTPPLLLERKQLLSKRHNPYFQHAEARYFLATKDGAPVGRISAQVDQLVQQHMGPGTGQFGMYDAIDDQGLAAELFARAEDWLVEQGMNRALGPFNLSINEEMGLLIEGFDTPPMVMMGHARPYYRKHLESIGYQKAIDAHAYWIDILKPIPDKIRKLYSWGDANPRLHIRQVDVKNIRREIDIILEIFNDAWRENWGFIPLTEAEIDKMARDLKPVLFPHLARICEYNGEPIAFMITLPDVNRLTHDLNGRLLPFGWLKLLRQLRGQKFTHFRVPLMGLRKSLQRSRIGGVAVFMLIEKIRRDAVTRGGKYGELSWILENNEPMRNILETMGSTAYKTYRIYEKPLLK